MDDLVYSGAGSGCNHDDEDQCTVTFDTGSGECKSVNFFFVP